MVDQRVLEPVMKEDEPLYLIGRATGQLEILLYLYRHGPTNKTRLGRSSVRSMDTVDRTLTILLRSGLVKCEVGTGFPFSKTYELTADGKRLVAAPITEWRTILSSR
jgi:DNA-binding HxlR family transcriptional regulator